VVRSTGPGAEARGRAEALRKILQAQVDGGDRPGPSSEELAEIKALKSQVRDLTEANEILKAASIFFAGELDPDGAELRVHRRAARPGTWGRVDLQPPHRAGPAGRPTHLPSLEEQPGVRPGPQRRSAAGHVAARRTGGPDGRPLPEVLYGRRKMTAWLARNGFPYVSKHTVDRLMRDEGMNGLVRGRSARTTVPAKTCGVRAGDLFNRIFTSPRPNHAWVIDFTYVRTWCGFVYVAFAIDLYSRAMFRHAGGVNPALPETVSGRYLSFAEREDIALARAEARAA